MQKSPLLPLLKSAPALFAAALLARPSEPRTFQAPDHEDSQAVSPDSAGDIWREARVQGPFREIPLEILDDNVPPVGEAGALPGPNGDTWLETPRSGPSFLGFAAGAYYPGPRERIDPELSALCARFSPDGREGQAVYAFVMFGARITAERRSELEALGVRVLGFHPHYCLKVLLPIERLEQVAGMPYVRWVGLARSWQKVHPVLARELERGPVEPRLAVWISVFEDDTNPASQLVDAIEAESHEPLAALAPSPERASRRVLATNGWQEMALRGAGIETSEYSAPSRSFRAVVDPGLLERVLQLDFVQFVSPDVPAGALHDESIPLVGGDMHRATYDGANSGEVVIGVVDSGMTISHVGLNNKWAAGWDFTGEGLGAWVDGREHGSHVTGTACGRGIVEDSWAGMAPGIGTYGPQGRLFNYKIIDTFDTTAGVNWNTLYTYMHNGWTDGNGVFTPRPHVLNHSWGSGSTPGGWVGTEPMAVAFDNEVYDYGQLHVFSAGNAGPGVSTVSLQASAKNVLTVGGVVDYNKAPEGLPGSLWNSSSRGPVADGRWKPNVVAPAIWVRSIRPQTLNEYSNGMGTSMASPHVTGLAAQLLDHHAFLRYRPAATEALLLATALPKDNTAIAGPGDAHLDLYGAGRIEGSRSHFSTSDQDLSFWHWIASGSAGYEVDVPVSTGATRMTVAFVYHEPGASVGANQALVNDWDMWVDAAPFSNGTNTGEYFAHQSAINNIELRSIENPAANTYRIKLHPDSTTTNCHLGLAVTVVYGDTTPTGTLSVSVDDAYVQPNESVVFTATATNPAYWASGVFFNTSSTIGDVLSAAVSTLKDGATANYMNNQHNGDDVLVGDIRHGQSRSVSWTTSWASEGSKTWSVDASSDNWIDQVDQAIVIVDGTEPGLATNVHSTSHSPGVWSNDTSIDYAWTAGSDNLSGIDGYGIATSTNPAGGPATTKDLEQVTSYSEVLASNALPYYFKLRSVDNSGNWSSGFAVSPGYLIDAQAPTAAAGLFSASHQIGATSCDAQLRMVWTAASDVHSGLAGYVALWDHAAASIPAGAPNLPAGATMHIQVLGNANDWYFHLRAVDLAGNYGPTVHSGPYSVNDSQWSTYCTAKVSSNFCVPTMAAQGPASLANPAGFSVTTSAVESHQNGLTYFGTSGPNNAAFQGGVLCVLAPLHRMPVKFSGGGGVCQGALSYTLAEMQANGTGGALIVPGAVLNLQTWFRDPPAASTTGLSNGLQFLVCP